MSTPQAPIESGFGFNSTARDVVAGLDLAGRTAVITGGSAGLGVETAKALVSAGAAVILPVRSPQKARANLGVVADAVTLAEMDLGDPASIRRFSAQVCGEGLAVDMLINNAGIMATPLRRIWRGYESQFATNHLGHFLLTEGILPALRKAAHAHDGARVVSLSSLGHRISPVVFEDINFEVREYDKWMAYGQSKTANALFAVELDQREARNGIRAFSVHPGGIMTDLQREMAPEEMRAMGWIDEAGKTREGFKTPEQGAATAVWCAAAPVLGGMGGVYCEDCTIAEQVPADSRDFSGVRPYACDPDSAERLWTLSEGMVAP